jgi:hypothetical protein
MAAYAVKMKRDIAKRQSIVKLDGPKKRQRQYNIFEAIKKTQVKREQAQKPNCKYMWSHNYKRSEFDNLTSYFIASAPPPRSTIETHGVGANGQRLATPMELSLAKAQRDRSLAQALLEQRQLSAAYGLAAQRSHVSHHHKSLLIKVFHSKNSQFRQYSEPAILVPSQCHTHSYQDSQDPQLQRMLLDPWHQHLQATKDR